MQQNVDVSGTDTELTEGQMHCVVTELLNCTPDEGKGSKQVVVVYPANRLRYFLASS